MQEIKTALSDAIELAFEYANKLHLAGDIKGTLIKGKLADAMSQIDIQKATVLRGKVQDYGNASAENQPVANTSTVSFGTTPPVDQFLGKNTTKKKEVVRPVKKVAPRDFSVPPVEANEYDPSEKNDEGNSKEESKIQAAIDSGKIIKEDSELLNKLSDMSVKQISDEYTSDNLNMIADKLGISDFDKRARKEQRAAVIRKALKDRQ